jgi:type IV pilus assembly protein PilV
MNTGANRHWSQRRSSRGFSLVEVMVALVVTSVGLLGLAKMESLALSSTGVAGQRSLAAIQASSLAAMMHANRDYWASLLVIANSPITVDATPANNFSTAVPCTFASPCLPQAMADYDLQQWATALQGLLPGYQATITCATTPTAGVVSCAIQIQWAESSVALSKQQNLAATQLQIPTYTLYVEP